MKKIYLFTLIASVLCGIQSAGAETIIVKTRPLGFLQNILTTPIREKFKASFVRNFNLPIQSKNTDQLAKSMGNLEDYHVLRASSRASAEKLVAELVKRSDVVYAYIEPIYEPAVWMFNQDKNVPATEVDNYNDNNFVQLQDYLFEAPTGVDAVFAWTQAGGTGKNVTIADVEWGWNYRHKDLSNLTQIFGASGRYVDHGTAVMGEMIGTNDDYGVTGIAFDANAIGVSVTETDMQYPTVAEYMLFAALKLKPGDVMLLEMHERGPNSGGYSQQGYIPMEYFPANFEAIKAITSMGIYVVEAAGNGGENFDAPVYERLFDRNFRDSGAIIVGASAPPRENDEYRKHLSRLDFSNYGTAVDVMGYGTAVTTTGYGDLTHANENELFTADFGGTSSASPIVAGSVALLSSMARENGITIPPARMREILKASVTPQRYDETNGLIGGLPNIRKAWELFNNKDAVVTKMRLPEKNMSVAPATEVKFAAEERPNYGYSWKIFTAKDNAPVAAFEGPRFQYTFNMKGRFIVELSTSHKNDKGESTAVREIIVDDPLMAPQISYASYSNSGLQIPYINFAPIDMVVGDCFLEISDSDKFDKEHFFRNLRMATWELEEKKFYMGAYFIPEEGTYFTRMRCRTGLGDSPYSDVVEVSIADQIEGIERIPIEMKGKFYGKIEYMNSNYVLGNSWSLINGTSWHNVLDVYLTNDLLNKTVSLLASFAIVKTFEKAIIKDRFLITANGWYPINVFAIPNEPYKDIVNSAAALSLGVRVSDFFIDKNTLVAISGEGEVLLIDVKDPVHLKIEKRICFDTSPSSYVGYAFKDQVVYVATQDAIYEMNLSNKAIADLSVKKVPLSMDGKFISGIASIGDNIIVAISPDPKKVVEGNAKTTELAYLENEAIVSVSTLDTTCSGLGVVRDTLIIFEKYGFLGVTNDLKTIKFIHRSYTSDVPKPLSVDDRVIGQSNGNIVEYMWP